MCPERFGLKSTAVEETKQSRGRFDPPGALSFGKNLGHHGRSALLDRGDVQEGRGVLDAVCLHARSGPSASVGCFPPALPGKHSWFDIGTRAPLAEVERDEIRASRPSSPGNASI